MTELSKIERPALPANTADIPGWGADIDPANDPTYPFRHRDEDDHSGSWPRPPLQHADVEVLQSIEHKQRPAVVGTSTPPSGLSGILRRLAFRKSESNLLHWMLLLGADRINVVEGVVQDLATGRIPNVPGEMGVRAEWRHNKRGLVIKTAVTLALAAGAWTLLRTRDGEPRTGWRRR